jgi:hypothetical protein
MWGIVFAAGVVTGATIAALVLALISERDLRERDEQIEAATRMLRRMRVEHAATIAEHRRFLRSLGVDDLPEVRR